MNLEMNIFKEPTPTKQFWYGRGRASIWAHEEKVGKQRKQLADKLIYIADNIYYSYQSYWKYSDIQHAIKVILPFVGRDLIWAHANDFNGKIEIQRVKGKLHWQTQEDGEEDAEEKSGQITAFQIIAGNVKRLCVVQFEGKDKPLVWQETKDGGEYFVVTVKRLLGLGALISMILHKIGVKRVTWPDKLFCVLYYVVSGKGWKMYKQIVSNDLVHRYTSKAKMPLLEKVAGGKYFYRNANCKIKLNTVPIQ